jgi:nitroimidazol reductase NimA-like FMN-containing flavoprotein (pyridoxamine 5'-phosphate oxidase superfamily)
MDAGRVARRRGRGRVRSQGRSARLDDPSQPYVVPVAYARDGDRVLFHGSTGSRLFRALAGGAPTCFTVTLLDGLVLARSAFESSMNYRSVMVLGRCTALAAADKLAALETVSEHLMPGRWADVRPPTAKELAPPRCWHCR